MKKIIPRASRFLCCCLVAACGGQTLDVGSDGAPALLVPAGDSGGSAGMQAGKAGITNCDEAMITNGVGGRIDCAPMGTGGIVTEPGPEVPPVEDWPDPAGCAEGADSALTGIWRGYVQGSESDGGAGGESGLPDDGELVLTITGASAAKPCGSVVFGGDAPPAPATDAGAPYPAGTPDNDENMSPIPRRAYAGMPYTMLSSRWDGERLLFDVGFAQILESWCPLQTPHYDEGIEPAAYLCLPLWGGGHEAGEWYHLLNPDTGEVFTVPASQWAYCYTTSPVCACDAERCVASQTANRARFDLRVVGDEAEGTFDGLPVLLRREQ